MEPIDYGVDSENRFPVLSEDVQADVTLQVDIGVVHLRLALDLENSTLFIFSYFEYSELTFGGS